MLDLGVALESFFCCGLGCCGFCFGFFSPASAVLRDSWEEAGEVAPAWAGSFDFPACCAGTGLRLRALQATSFACFEASCDEDGLVCGCTADFRRDAPLAGLATLATGVVGGGFGQPGALRLRRAGIVASIAFLATEAKLDAATLMLRVTRLV